MTDGTKVVGQAFDVRASASDWLIAKQMSRAWSASDQAALDVWLSQSPENRIAYWRLEGAWSQARRLGALHRPMRQRPNMAMTRKSLQIFRMVAAVLLLAAMGGGAFVYLRQDNVGQTYQTPVGGHLVVAISDGSKIELNTDTVLHLLVSDGQRKAVLDKGEAYFQIQHDASRPFMVLAGARRIVDLGTKFVVRDNSDHVEVALLEGRAEIAPVRGSTISQGAILSPGDFAVATAGSLTVTKQAEWREQDQLAWRRGLLSFKHVTLADAAAEFNRYNSTRIIITDPQVARLTIHGIFPTTDVAGFADAVQAYFKLHVVTRGNEVLITR